MSLRSKVALLLVSVFAVYIAADYVVQQYVVFPRFLALEREEAVKDIERSREALEREVKHLSVLCHDWAAWDDTYGYIQDHNESYAEATLNDGSFETAKINLLYMVDSRGTVVWGKILDLTTMETLRINAFPGDRFPPDHPLLQHPTPESEISGVVLTEHGPMLVASRPILTSDLGGPIRGSVIMGRLLTEEVVAGLVEQTRVQFTVWPISAPEMPEEDRAARERIAAVETPLVEERGDSLLAVYTMAKDIDGKPALLLRADVPRDISAKGAAALRFVVLSLLSAGLGTLAILLVTLQRMVVRPIGQLTAHATAVGSTGDMTTRLDLGRTDEIGTLAREFDRMVQSLADFRARAAETSRQAGKAEIATGVLHNVGNVMTNVNVIATSLREKVGKSRMSGLPKAVDLMRQHAADLGRYLVEDERGRQLPAYLEQLASHWAVEKEGLLKDLQLLADNLAHVNLIVDAQQAHAKASGVAEPTRLAELVDSALMITQASYRRHHITVRRELADLPVIPVDRAKLLQVLVNLLTNAKEALDPVDAQARQVVVRLRVVDDRLARIEVSDSGMGIAAQDGVRIFAQGFTTKKGGHGIGLHYSALAAREMGGALTFHSDGPGHGATFFIDLPLEPIHRSLAA